MKFYTHLYKTLFTLHAGMFSEDACLVHMYSLRVCLIIIVADDHRICCTRLASPCRAPVVNAAQDLALTGNAVSAAQRISKALLARRMVCSGYDSSAWGLWSSGSGMMKA